MLITNNPTEVPPLRHPSFVASLPEEISIITHNTQETSIALIETPEKDEGRLTEDIDKKIENSSNIDSITSWHAYISSGALKDSMLGKRYSHLTSKEAEEFSKLIIQLGKIEQGEPYPIELTEEGFTGNQIMLILHYLYPISIGKLSENYLASQFLMRIVPYIGDLVREFGLSYKGAQAIYTYALHPNTSDRVLFALTFESIREIKDTKLKDMIIQDVFGSSGWKKFARFLDLTEDNGSSAMEGFSLLWDWTSSAGQHNHSKKGKLLMENISTYKFLIECPRLLLAFLRLSGVRCFGRYSKYVLGAQLRSLVYPNTGILMTPISDNNGSSYETKKIFEKFFKEQEKEPETHMAIAEASDFMGIVSTLARLKKIRKEHEIETPFSYLILQTHGGGNSIHVGPADDYIDRELASSFIITSDEEEEIYSKRIQRLWSRYFDPNGYLVLASCKSGADQGIAMRLSRILPGVTIIASKSIGYLDSISYNNGDLHASFIGSDIGTDESKEGEGKESVVYYKNGVSIHN